MTSFLLTPKRCLQASLRRNQMLVKILGQQVGFAFYSPFKRGYDKGDLEVLMKPMAKTGPQTRASGVMKCWQM
jgi:hypothetical protein